MQMPNTKTKDSRYNSSCCRDNTAHQALSNIEKEEKRKLIMSMKALAAKKGYRVVGAIKLKEMEC